MSFCHEPTPAKFFSFIKDTFSIPTLLGYVTDYIKETGETKFNLALHEFIKPLEEERIISVCNKVGIEKVSLIKKELPREIK